MLPSACRLGVAHAKQDVNGKQLKSTNAIITFSAKRKTTGQQPPGATPRRYPLAESCEALCRGRFGTPDRRKALVDIPDTTCLGQP